MSPLVKRSHDIARANVIVNHPAVRPFVGAAELGELDLAPLIERPEHWFLKGEHGAFLLTWSAPRIYEVHTMILPEGRGRWAMDAAKAGTKYASEHGARMLWTKVSPSHHHTALFARLMGMRPCDMTIDTFGEPYTVMSMEL